MNPFGGNAFASGFPQQFPSPLGQSGFGQFGNPGGFYNNGIPFQANNVPFPNMNGAVLPPRSYSPGPMGNQFGPGFGGAVLPPRSFSPGPMGNQFGPGFGGAVLPPRNFSPGPMGNQFGPDFNAAVLPPRNFSPGPMGNQFGPGFAGPVPANLAFNNNNGAPFVSGQPLPNQFGSGNYDRPRSRHRSKSRRRRNSQSSSSSDDEYHRRGPLPNRHNNGQYQNVAPFPHLPPVQPGNGVPFYPPQGPSW